MTFPIGTPCLAASASRKIVAVAIRVAISRPAEPHVPASTARGDGPNGFSFDASLMACVRSSRSTFFHRASRNVSADSVDILRYPQFRDVRHRLRASKGPVLVYVFQRTSSFDRLFKNTQERQPEFRSVASVCRPGY